MPAQLQRRLTMPRHERIDVHQLCDAIAGPLGDTGNDHAGIAVTDQDDIAKMLALQQRHDVANMGLEIDVLTQAIGVSPETHCARTTARSA